MTTTEQPIWRVIGFDTHKQMNQSLLFMEDTAAAAFAKATRLHPHLDIWAVSLVEDDSWRACAF